MRIDRTFGGLRAALTRRVTHLREHREAGMATAEYAIGTVAAASLGGILLWIAKSEWVRELVADLIRKALGLG